MRAKRAQGKKRRGRGEKKEKGKTAEYALPLHCLVSCADGGSWSGSRRVELRWRLRPLLHPRRVCFDLAATRDVSGDQFGIGFFVQSTKKTPWLLRCTPVTRAWLEPGMAVGTANLFCARAAVNSWRPTFRCFSALVSMILLETPASSCMAASLTSLLTSLRRSMPVLWGHRRDRSATYFILHQDGKSH